jgi:hypothetical protein
MSREMRVGSGYHCVDNNSTVNNGNYRQSSCEDVIATDTNGKNWTIVFTSSKKNTAGNCNLVYAYRYEGFKLKKAQESNSNVCNNFVFNSGDFYDVTSSNIKITKSIVTVDSDEGYAEFFFKGESGAKVKDKVDFAIQTSVTQRIE